MMNLVMLGFLSAVDPFSEDQGMEGILPDLVPSETPEVSIAAFDDGVLLIGSRL
jgi:hypothetical protein